MNTIYNFSAGPAKLPDEVMKQAYAEFFDWQNTGCGAMEVSHRSPEFIALAKQTEVDLRTLLNVPDNYKILFFPGGAQAQFSMIPMNLLDGFSYAAYARTGTWSRLAYQEACRYGTMRLVADGEASGYTAIPDESTWLDYSDAAYLYYCDNETVHGLEFNSIPDAGNVPIICDMSSNLLTRQFDINRFGMVFACSQKNLGPAGITVVIIREDLLQRKSMPMTPSLFNYKKMFDKESMMNTPATYSWYVLSLVLKWVIEQGGVAEMERRAIARSTKVYAALDQYDTFINSVDPANRSRINPIFHFSDESLKEKFLVEAKQQGLVSLKGHRSVGGIRASMYNAMPEAGADALVKFLKQFSLAESKVR